MNRKSIRDGLAAMAILFFAALNNNAVAQPFADGDFLTYSQGGWHTSGGLLLFDNYSSVYSSTFELFEVGILGGAGFSIAFTSPSDLYEYLPASGPIGPLTGDVIDPSSTAAAAFGGEVAALKLNIDFSDAGLTQGALGFPFGDLQIQPPHQNLWVNSGSGKAPRL